MERAGKDDGRRALGPWALTSVGLNMVVGAGFFLAPSQMFAVAGRWSPWTLLLVGVGMIPVALSFAEVGSRFAGHGGPYLYVRAAFGKLAGFEIGWMMWLSRIISHASVLSGLLVLIETIAGHALSPVQKGAIVIGPTSTIALLSAIGGKANARLITALALVKLAAVAALIATGLPHADWTQLAPEHGLSLRQIGAASILGVFVLAGFEMLTIPAGEATHPERDIPRALLIALGGGLGLAVATNALAIALLPNLASSKLALAEAAQVAMGRAGWLMIAGAAVLAAVGNNVGSLLACSRLLQGLADQGDVPPWLGARTRRRGYPVGSVAISTAVIVAFSLSGSFAWLIGLAGGVRVVIYAAVAIAAARLRSPRLQGAAPEPRFRSPVPRLVLWAVLLGSVAVLASMTAAQMTSIALSAAAGLVLHQLNVRRHARAVVPLVG